MHGLIFETSVWLLAESTRLLSVPRQSAFHWSQTWGKSPESFQKGPTRTGCMQIPASASGVLPVSKIPLSSFIPANLHNRDNPCVQSLHVLFPLKKIEASTMRSQGVLAEVLLHTPRKANPSHDLFMLHTITGSHRGTWHATVDPATAISNLVELHIVKYAGQISRPIAHHAPWFPMRLGMLLHHWCWRGTNLQAPSKEFREGTYPHPPQNNSACLLGTSGELQHTNPHPLCVVLSVSLRWPACMKCSRAGGSCPILW